MQSRVRGRLASPSLAMTSSEATQAWPGQGAGQRPRPLLFATQNPPCFSVQHFWLYLGDMILTLDIIVFLLNWSRSCRAMVPNMGHVLNGPSSNGLGWFREEIQGALSTHPSSQSCQVKCRIARSQALSSCLRSRLCLPPGLGLKG